LLGFTTTADWLLARVELTAQDGRRVDLHPVAFAADGSGIQQGLNGVVFAYSQDGFTEGVIDGRRLTCLSVPQQLRFREGYEPRDVDLHDVGLLRQLDRS
jgi:lincosamide nucleotidyltransferase A/C/D/E